MFFDFSLAFERWVGAGRWDPMEIRLVLQSAFAVFVPKNGRVKNQQEEIPAGRSYGGESAKSPR